LNFNCIELKTRPTYLLLLSLNFIAIFSACEKELDTGASDKYKEQLKESYRYYPLELNKSWVYSIDSIYYSDNLGIIEVDTVRGVYRETLVDTFRNESDQLVYRCLKEMKNVNQTWSVLRVYSLIFLTNQLLRTEDNVTLVDLIFPIRSGSRWDTRVYIDSDANYLIRGKAITLFKDWPDTYVANEYNGEYNGTAASMIDIIDVEADNNIILYKASKRTYAKGIGMIRKEQAFFTTQRTEDPDLPWEQKAEIGFKAVQTLLEYK